MGCKSFTPSQHHSEQDSLAQALQCGFLLAATGNALYTEVENAFHLFSTLVRRVLQGTRESPEDDVGWLQIAPVCDWSVLIGGGTNVASGAA